MKEFLKNYTSAVPITHTIYRIEQVLIRCGVLGIMKEYGLNGKVVAITFKVEAEPQNLTIRLPADEEKATEALWLEYVDGDKLAPEGDRIVSWNRKKKKKADFGDQGARTAWKIIQDWVEVQMSMIQLKQADLLQVFLPYVFDGRQTFYQALKEAKFAGLLTEKTDDA